MTTHTNETAALLTLDLNEQIPVQIARMTDEQGGTQLRCSLDMRRVHAPRLLRNLQTMLGVQVDGMPLPAEMDYDPNKFLLTLTLPLPLQNGIKAETVNLTLTRPDCKGVNVAERVVTAIADANGRYVLSPQHRHERMNVTEIKPLANADRPLENIPYPRAQLTGYDAKRHAPVTELHTHSSAQLRAEDLMDIALQHDRRATDGKGITYPIELLELLGCPITQQQRAYLLKGASIRFDPGRNEVRKLECEKSEGTCDVLRLRDLTSEQRDAIVRKMAVAQDAILQFSQFDPQMYRFRNPLVKNAALTRAMILKIAEDYQRNGVEYAELSTSSMLDDVPWFQAMSEAVVEAEKSTGVKLRFLAAIPRSFEPDRMMMTLEKIKYAARHPLIVGVDMLGYEFNSTKDFVWALEHIACWASASEGTELDPKMGWNFSKDFVVRVHAGETGKHHDNVMEAAKIAQKYGVQVRIAHAVNAQISDKEMKMLETLSNRGLLAFELCPPSNVAYNNLPRADGAPFTKLGKKVTTYIATDGAGAIQSNAEQLGLDALYAGWSLRDLEQMRAKEQSYIHARAAHDANKQRAFDTLYGNGEPRAAEPEFFKAYAEHLHELKGRDFTRVAKGKIPILVVGAGGESYKQVSVKREVEVAMEMLALAMNPDASVAMMGRVKREGVNALFDGSIDAKNADIPSKRMRVLGVITKNATQVPRSLTDCKVFPDDPSAVPTQIFKTAESLQPPAIPVFIGGSNFTGDIHQYYHEAALPFVTMRTAEGASKHRAGFVDESKHFTDGITLLKTLDQQIHQYAERFGNICPFNETLYCEKDGVRQLNDQALLALREEAKQRIQTREKQQ